jgi:hypothetical protein
MDNKPQGGGVVNTGTDSAVLPSGTTSFLLFLRKLLILGVLLVFAKYVTEQIFDRSERMVSQVDGKNYVVREEGSPKEKKLAANRLAEVRAKVDQLVNYMAKHDQPDAEIAYRLKVRWLSCNLRETGTLEDSAAYTVNKGEEMRLCVRKPDGEEGLEKLNTTMFVVLHELGHMMSITYGHNEEFKKNFSFIVHLGSALGVYKPENFSSSPVSFCGTEINTTPCNDGLCKYTTIPLISG